jgi:hypothetical protein
MKRKFILFLIVLSAHLNSQVAGLYVDKFNLILGNVQKEDSLLNYAVSKGFNYLALYDLWTIHSSSPLTNTTTALPLANFINKAKTVFGISKIGATGENYWFFSNVIHIYNQQHSNINQKFDVYNLEFEFWITSSVGPSGVYCVNYLQPGGFTCDTSGGFKFYIRELRRIDSLGNTAGITSETYIGWPNSGQAKAIARTCDRVLVHAYVSNQSTTFTYTKNRLIDLSGSTSVAKVMPIFSAEPSFMGPWVQTNSPMQAFTNYSVSYTADPGAWKSNVNLLGYQWFAYSYMPKSVSSTGMRELIRPAQIIQNPAQEGQLLFVPNEEGNFVIKDMFGREIDTFSIKETHTLNRRDISGLSTGVYFLVNRSGVVTKFIVIN